MITRRNLFWLALGAPLAAVIKLPGSDFSRSGVKYTTYQKHVVISKEASSQLAEAFGCSHKEVLDGLAQDALRMSLQRT